MGRSQIGETVSACDVKIAGHRIRYLRAGAGPAVVLVHGLMGYSFSWRFTIPALATHFTVYAPDLPGTGFSERVADLDCSMRASAARLLKFFEKVGLEEFDLVATSHGGALGAWVATMATEMPRPRIRKLVLVAPANPWSRGGRKRIRVLSTVPGAMLFRLLALRMTGLHRYVLERLYADRSRIPAGTMEGYAEPLKLPGSIDYLLAVVACWHHDLAELEAAYRKIRIPTLLVWGDHDLAVLPESAPKVQRAISGSKLITMRGVGHLPYEEAPQEFNRIVLDFLRARG
ncbi:MAG: alpha/beta fold hydrolase [Terriglobales bacterium]